MPKPLEQWQVDTVHNRRPQKLQRIGDAHPGKKPDRLQGCVFIAQPVSEGVAYQEKGKAGRKPEQQHRERFGPQVIGNPVLVRAHAFIVYWSFAELNRVPQPTQRVFWRTTLLVAPEVGTGVESRNSTSACSAAL